MINDKSMGKKWKKILTKFLIKSKKHRYLVSAIGVNVLIKKQEVN